MVLNNLLVLNFDSLDFLKEFFNFGTFADVSFSLGFFELSFSVAQFVYCEFLFDAVLFDLSQQLLGFGLHIWGLFVRHVDSAENVRLARHANRFTGHSRSCCHTLVFENVPHLLFFRQFPVGFGGIRLKLLGLFVFVKVNVLFHTICCWQDVFDFFTALFLIELHFVAWCLNAESSFTLLLKNWLALVESGLESVLLLKALS